MDVREDDGRPTFLGKPIPRSHPMPLSCRYMSKEDILLAYLDLLGTKSFYKSSELPEQIERISQVVGAVHAEIDNAFEENKTNLFVHMYADSLVIAQKNLIDNCAKKFVELMLKVQYKILINSEFNQIRVGTSDARRSLMPTLSRALIRRGSYYGMICGEMQQTIDDICSNFSLVGGSAIVEMSKALEGLPMGTYIDASLITEAGVEKERLIDVTDGSGMKFVKPGDRFDFLRSILPVLQPFDDWIKQLIKSSGDNDGFKEKVVPWAYAIQKSQPVNRCLKELNEKNSC